MATLLHLQTSLSGTEGQSAQLAARYIAQWQQRNPQGQVIVRDLIADPVPHLDSERMQVLRGMVEAPLSATQQAVLDQSDALLDELQAADEIVIGVPLYNFSIPTQLKSYLDHLARAGVTFRYTENGPEGLIAGKKVVLLATRGGLYREQGIDFQVPFMKQFLGFMGMTDVDVIYAEGLAMGPLAKQSLSDAQQQVDQLAQA
ncbi:MAG: FMN-dependent NADH-azoreductase [Marinobacterium sp.]|nr:FMN-dependent NADH-azoreductase [Marinobacterium sp.]